MAMFLAMLGMTYLASTSSNLFVRIILVPIGMVGMVSSAVIFFLSIIILIL